MQDRQFQPHRFLDDYSEGAHPEILRAIVEGNHGQQYGYGKDEHSALAAHRIASYFDVEADVHFIPGGTHANLVGIGSILRPHQAVVAASSEHIANHAAGATEAIGHKVITVEAGLDGKLTPALIDLVLNQHDRGEHMVMPKVVYISHGTYMGTAYTLNELTELIHCAKSHDMYVYLDGARLAMALASDRSDMSPAELGHLGVDMMAVGGTKVGGLFGEALVVANPQLRQDFRYHIKQRGALLAKGRFLGLQFARFFDEDQLWLDIGRQSVSNAAYLETGLLDLGIELAFERHINQVFASLPIEIMAVLKQDFAFWSLPVLPSSSTAIARFMCSWATPKEAIDALLARLSELVSEGDHSFSYST